MSSSAQLSTGDDVYLGVWTNWSHGKIREATLTVSRRNGGLLTAFLALLVGVAGTSFWRIGCFFIHRYFSSKVAADALYHQKQAILRNSSNSQSGLLTLLQTCWAWRRNTTASFWRFLPSICFAIITLTSFAIAGIFSSAVATSMGQKVLLKSPNCGTWNLDGYDQEQLSLWQPSITKGMVSSLAYAQRCYRKDVNPRDCAIFIQPRLEWKTDHNATCPFVDKNICLSDSGNLRLDNGYINSDHHLGINNPPGTSFLIRTVVDCAPLQTKGYTKNTRVADRITTEFFYGEPDYSLWNSTYEYSARIPGMDLNDEVAGTGNNKEAPTELYYDYSLRSVNRWSCSGSIDSQRLFAALLDITRMLTERPSKNSATSLQFLLCGLIRVTSRYFFYRQMTSPSSKRAMTLGMLRQLLSRNLMMRTLHFIILITPPVVLHAPHNINSAMQISSQTDRAHHLQDLTVQQCCIRPMSIAIFSMLRFTIF